MAFTLSNAGNAGTLLAQIASRKKERAPTVSSRIMGTTLPTNARMPTVGDFSNDPNRRIAVGSFLQLRPVDLIDLLWCESRKRSQKVVAAELGISPQYLSDILKGRREISTEVARRLGFERVVTYVRFDHSGEDDVA